MKKKLLSLMMAATMVATGTVSAFAKTITGPEMDGAVAKEYETEVQITGDVADETGNVKPGTINVTVPTTATFSVNQHGNFTGTNLNVQNHGTQAIEVFVDEFIDLNGTNGIELVKNSELANKSRKGVSLRLVGNRTTAYLGNQGSANKGVFNDIDLNQEALKGIKVSEISAGTDGTISLEGSAGTNGTLVTTPEQDTFTLKLMIRKA